METFGQKEKCRLESQSANAYLSSSTLWLRQACVTISYVFDIFFIFIGVQLTYNAVLVSDVQQSSSVSYTYKYSTFFQIIFAFRPLENTE